MSVPPDRPNFLPSILFFPRYSNTKLDYADFDGTSRESVKSVKRVNPWNLPATRWPRIRRADHVPVASYIPLHSDSFLCNRSPGPGLSDSSSIGYATRHNSIVAVICP